MRVRLNRVWQSLDFRPTKEVAMRVYRYVGPAEILESVAGGLVGAPLLSMADLAQWIASARQKPDPYGMVVATFVIDRTGLLRVADRHSEHVACAGGEPVLSAGEISFELSGAGPQIVAVTNQSTGYCPEPESWAAVAAALNSAKLDFRGPDRFEPAFEFRRCPSCKTINLVREEIFLCGVCDAALPVWWNLAEGE
jgi:hypothetical protein